MMMAGEQQAHPLSLKLPQQVSSARRPNSPGVQAPDAPVGSRWTRAARLDSGSRLGASEAQTRADNETDNILSACRRSSEANQQLQEDNGTDSQDGGRPGAVMGIFFKVWSLVKGKRAIVQLSLVSLACQSTNMLPGLLTVTRGRSQAHKVRRQTSAEPSQLQGSPSWPTEHDHRLIPGKAAPVTRLQDGHFRRAGSQPAPSIRARAGQANMLQVKSTTGSTSSGVSSATSGEGAFSSPGGERSSSAVRRHLSAYSLRRSTADTPLSGPNPTRADGSSSPVGTNSKERSLSSSASSWASRIKRSATTVNQADLSSSASKYKFKRVHEQLDTLATQSTKPQPPSPVGPAWAAVAGSRRATIPPPGPLELELELGACGPKDRRQTNVSASVGSASDLDDSNDIYSTPHDSIQSVPSTAPLQSHSERMAPTIHQVTSQAYPIIKSFSTSNFSQLLAGSCKQMGSNPTQFKPIVELESANSKQVAVEDDGSADKANSASKGSRRHMANSRFFISSSSSEDSTSGQQQQHTKPARDESANLNLQVESQASSDSSHMQLELRNRLPLSVLQGAHYHAAARPDSLILAQPARASTQALMSPLDWSAPSPFVRRPSRPFRPIDFSQISSASKRPSLANPNLSQFLAGRSTPVVSRASPVAPSHEWSRAPELENQQNQSGCNKALSRPFSITNSVSLYDCKLPALGSPDKGNNSLPDSEYKLANMLLEFGSNPSVKDELGNTVLMYACLNDNVPCVKCLLERNVDPNQLNNLGLTAMDLLCSKDSTPCRLSILDLLIEHGADVDRQASDGSRLLDRLIAEHQPSAQNKLAYIECLLRNGAKLGSPTWAAAAGKHDVQLRLLKKLCHDGYFLYKVSEVAKKPYFTCRRFTNGSQPEKKSSIEASVYRFEYALRRIAEMEQQLAQGISRNRRLFYQQQVGASVRQVKFQTFLGLSRCERKRKVGFNRASCEAEFMSSCLIGHDRVTDTNLINRFSIVL